MLRISYFQFPAVVAAPAERLRCGLMEAPATIPVTIRPFKPADQRECQTLYREGLLGDTKLADNDTGFDMDDIESAYMKKPGSCFFVAIDPAGNLVGTIGVQQHEA